METKGIKCAVMTENGPSSITLPDDLNLFFLIDDVFENNKQGFSPDELALFQKHIGPMIEADPEFWEWVRLLKKNVIRE